MIVAIIAFAISACSDSSDSKPRPTPTASVTATPLPSATATASATAVSTTTVTAVPTATASSTATAIPSETPTASPTATETPDGFVPRETFRERQLDYLTFATAQLAPGSITNVIAHMERNRIDPTFPLTPGAVPADVWDGIFTKMATLQDTRDFDAIELVNLLYGYADNPLLAPGLIEKVEAALIAFKFWYTEPTPDGLIDESYYWSENHQVLFHAIEYLIGQRYPDRVMPSDGRTGAEHRADAREKLLRWFDFRARFGFTEWHSNVYYQEDLNALLTLVEFADEPAISERAAGIIDLLLFDIAMHTQRGNFGATHGRSYKKDKMTGRDDDTWNAVKLLFDRSDGPYTSIGDTAAAFFARAQRYRVPEAIWRIGRSEATFTDRERMSLPLDEDGPAYPNPEAPFGYSFTDPRDLVVWWGMAGLTAWQVVPLTVNTINEYNLWDTRLFSRFLALRPLTADLEFAQTFAAATSAYTSFGLLKEVNTQHHRTADYLLSSAQDYRKGTLNGQMHAWQATFDAEAIVFTQHPATPIVRSTNWRDDPDPGYWTGEATAPRSAQHENVAIHIYTPLYLQQVPAPLDAFRYEPYTHAYFPQDHFDEVVQEAGWTFGRAGDGYVALYSWRPTEWIEYDPNVYATNGMTKPFDLLAPGGAANVWIVECGRRADDGAFEDFRAAILAADLEVASLAPRPGFTVRYDSPSQGVLTFGWEGPFTVDGVEVSLADYPRHDNPFAQTAYGSRQTTIEHEGYRVALDFAAGTRNVSRVP